MSSSSGRRMTRLQRHQLGIKDDDVMLLAEVVVADGEEGQEIDHNLHILISRNDSDTVEVAASSLRESLGSNTTASTDDDASCNDYLEDCLVAGEEETEALGDKENNENQESTTTTTTTSTMKYAEHVAAMKKLNDKWLEHQHNHELHLTEQQEQQQPTMMDVEAADELLSLYRELETVRQQAALDLAVRDRELELVRPQAALELDIARMQMEEEMENNLRDIRRELHEQDQVQALSDHQDQELTVAMEAVRMECKKEQEVELVAALEAQREELLEEQGAMLSSWSNKVEVERKDEREAWIQEQVCVVERALFATQQKHTAEIESTIARFEEITEKIMVEHKHAIQIIKATHEEEVCKRDAAHEHQRKEREVSYEQDLKEQRLFQEEKALEDRKLHADELEIVRNELRTEHQAQLYDLQAKIITSHSSAMSMESKMQQLLQQLPLDSSQTSVEEAIDAIKVEFEQERQEDKAALLQQRRRIAELEDVNRRLDLYHQGNVKELQNACDREKGELERHYQFESENLHRMMDIAIAEAGNQAAQFMENGRKKLREVEASKEKAIQSAVEQAVQEALLQAGSDASTKNTPSSVEDQEANAVVIEEQKAKIAKLETELSKALASWRDDKLALQQHHADKVEEMNKLHTTHVDSIKEANKKLLRAKTMEIVDLKTEQSMGQVAALSKQEAQIREVKQSHERELSELKLSSKTESEKHTKEVDELQASLSDLKDQVINLETDISKKEDILNTLEGELACLRSQHEVDVETATEISETEKQNRIDLEEQEREQSQLVCDLRAQLSIVENEIHFMQKARENHILAETEKWQMLSDKHEDELQEQAFIFENEIQAMQDGHRSLNIELSSTRESEQEMLLERVRELSEEFEKHCETLTLLKKVEGDLEEARFNNETMRKQHAESESVWMKQASILRVELDNARLELTKKTQFQDELQVQIKALEERLKTIVAATRVLQSSQNDASLNLKAYYEKQLAEKESSAKDLLAQMKHDCDTAIATTKEEALTEKAQFVRSFQSNQQSQTESVEDKAHQPIGACIATTEDKDCIPVTQKAGEEGTESAAKHWNDGQPKQLEISSRPQAAVEESCTSQVYQISNLPGTETMDQSLHKDEAAIEDATKSFFGGRVEIDRRAKQNTGTEKSSIETMSATTLKKIPFEQTPVQTESQERGKGCLQIEHAVAKMKELSETIPDVQISRSEESSVSAGSVSSRRSRIPKPMTVSMRKESLTGGRLPSRSLRKPEIQNSFIDLEEAGSVKSTPRSNLSIAAVKRGPTKASDTRILLLFPSTPLVVAMIREMGATLIEEIDQAHTATHTVVCDGLRRTPKLLIALSCTSNFVSLDWLVNSSRRKQVLNHKDYRRLTDKEAEVKYDFCLRHALQNGKENRKVGGMLAGWNLVFCDGVAGNKAPSQIELDLIARAAGATVISLTALDEVPNKAKFVVITSDPPTLEQNADIRVQELNQAGARSFTTNWLFDCLMHQKLSGMRRGLGSPTNK